MIAPATEYEAVFKRPLPTRFEEYTACLGCGCDTEKRDCGCPAGVGFHARRKDGQPLTAEDRKELFPEKYR